MVGGGGGFNNGHFQYQCNSNCIEWDSLAYINLNKTENQSECLEPLITWFTLYNFMLTFFLPIWLKPFKCLPMSSIFFLLQLLIINLRFKNYAIKPFHTLIYVCLVVFVTLTYPHLTNFPPIYFVCVLKLPISAPWVPILEYWNSTNYFVSSCSFLRLCFPIWVYDTTLYPL